MLSGQTDLTVISESPVFGGVWQNIKVEDKLIERFPHVIEFETDQELENLKEIFKLTFLEEDVDQVCFWIGRRRYFVSSRLDCLKFAFHEFLHTISLRRLKRSLGHVIYKRRYCIPTDGFSGIARSIEEQFKELNCAIIHEKVTSIKPIDGFVSIKTDKSNHEFSVVHLPRGSTDISFFVGEKTFHLDKPKIIISALINGTSKNLGRYNKFYRGLIDRICFVGDDQWIAQTRIGVQHDISQNDFFEALKALKIFDGEIKVSKVRSSNASSFNLSDKEFQNLRSFVPKNIKVYDSKALSHLSSVSL